MSPTLLACFRHNYWGVGLNTGKSKVPFWPWMSHPKAPKKTLFNAKWARTDTGIIVGMSTFAVGRHAHKPWA